MKFKIMDPLHVASTAQAWRTTPTEPSNSITRQGIELTITCLSTAGESIMEPNTGRSRIPGAQPGVKMGTSKSRRGRIFWEFKADAFGGLL